MNRTIGNIFKGDKVIWMIFFFLCLISIVEVYSSSSTLSYKSGNYWWPAVKHTSQILLGFIAMVITLHIECRYFKSMTIFLLGGSFLMLVMVLILGHATNGAQRWLTIFGIQFQPSEIAKGALILSVAQILSAMQTEKGADRRAVRYILITCAFIIPLILVENFSTAFLLSTVIFCMMFIGLVPLKQLGKIMGIVVITGAMGLALIMVSPNEQTADDPVVAEMTVDDASKEEPGKIAKVFHRFSTWKSRILSFTNKEDIKPEDFDLDKHSQVGHSNIAIATSNIIGKGPGNSEERDFLPQAYSDFIYTIIIEETGIGGAFIVALLYIILLFRTGQIANRCENMFPALLSMGLALQLVTQALFNMLVAVGLAPVTGQPLPLISRGGTSTIINCIYVGVILSISRSAKQRPKDSKKVVVAPNIHTQPAMQ